MNFDVLCQMFFFIFIKTFPNISLLSLNEHKREHIKILCWHLLSFVTDPVFQTMIVINATH